MIAIVNVTENWGIGAENRLLVSIRADLKRFRELTWNKTVICGRKTLETFPNGAPLNGRKNLILSRNPNFSAENAEVFSDIAQLKAAVCDLPGDAVFVIGGQSVYRQLLPDCTAAYVTKTRTVLPCDRFFPNLDALPNWSRAEVSEWMCENGIQFRYEYYVNLDKKAENESAEKKA